ncbi:restriction endonuclease subunit S, partial [Rhodoferax sp.]|uniref:restriction endonuclease subunit S n=1 Tax=Rhodoferax sp. TaxID=50421 RepID=UPI003BB48C55
MNATQLLEHFDRLAEAPGAVPRLRRFILDLAVRGKLVEQDAGDEPAAELLKRIQTERFRVLNKPVKRDALLGAEPESTDIQLPVGWVWSKLGNLCTKTGSGSTPAGGKDAYVSSGVPFLRSQNVYDDGLRLDGVAFISDATQERMSSTTIKAGDLLLNITGGSIGRCAIVPDSFVIGNINQHVAIIRLALPESRCFLHCVICSDYFQKHIFGNQTGAGREGLPKNRMDEILIPVAPLTEQHRIVAKVDELMALCDQLEAAQQERERRRERLAAASLQRLNQPAADTTPETQREHARFHLHHLPRLTTRPEHIKALRQLLVNLAVVGKLAQPELNDEPADVLLEKIWAEKKSRGLLKSAKESREANIDLTMSNLPTRWAWTTFESFATEIATGPFGSALHQSDYIDGGIPLVNPSHMIDGRIVAHPKISVAKEIANDLASYRMKSGDVVMARRGEVGRAAIVTDTEAGWLCGTGSFFVSFHKEIDRQFVILLLRSDSVRCYLAGAAVGTTMVNLNHGILKRIPVALPPAAEQHRIVAKVDELMALCDQLETQLNTTQTDSRRLLEAVLETA